MSINLKDFELSPVFSNHERIRLEINNQKKSGEILNYWKLNNIYVYNPVKEQIKKWIKKYYELNENENIID